MKRIFVLMLALCLAILPCAVQAEGNAQEDADTGWMHDARYFFEHKMIPPLFYEDPEALIEFMRNDGPFTLWTRFSEKNGLDPVYSAEDFGVRDFSQEGGLEMVMISMPTPPDSPLCFRIYLCYDPATKSAGVFTLEYDNFLGDSCFTCGWSKSGDHLNFGGGRLLNKNSADYEAGLAEEAESIRGLMRDGAIPQGE